MEDASGTRYVAPDRHFSLQKRLQREPQFGLIAEEVAGVEYPPWPCRIETENSCRRRCDAVNAMLLDDF